MADRKSEDGFRVLSRFSLYNSGLGIAFGVMVLTGWALHLQRLKGIIPGQVPVKANTGVCFVLIGMGLWLALAGFGKQFTRVTARVAALLASAIGLLSFLEFWGGWDLGIDQLLFPAGPDDLPGSVRLALMSPIAAADFFLLGLAIAVLDNKGRWWRLLQNALPAIAAVAATFGILDFVLDPTNTHTHIAPMTALILFLFSFAVLFARAENGLGRLFLSRTVGGLLCRRLLPSAMLIPIAIAWLRWKGHQAGLYSDWTGLAIMTVVCAALLAGLTIWTAFVVDRSDADRNKAEESARRLAAIVTSSNDAIIGKTLDGIVTSWNSGAEAIYGYSAEEMIGRPLTRIIPPDLLSELQAFLHNLRRGESILHHESERIRKDGKRIPVSISISPLKDEKGKIVGASTIARDISERKRAEDEVRAGRDRLALAMTAAKAGSFDWDIVGNVDLWSPEKELLYGLRPGQFSGSRQDWEAFVVPEDLPRVKGLVDLALQTGDFASEFRIRRRDNGEIRWMNIRAKVVFDQGRKPLRMVGINLDVTERKQAEEKLQEASRYTRSLIEASLDPLVTISAEGKITDVNQATENATGISRDRLIGSDFSTYFTEPERARQGYRQVFTSGLVRDYPLTIRHTSGSAMEVVYNAAVFRNARGEVEGVFAAARDVTDLKRTEQELRLSRERLALALKAGHSGTFDWDMQNNVNRWTPEVEEVHGLAPGEFGGTFEDWEALVLPADLPSAKARIESSLKTGEFAGEWRIHRRNDGQIRWIAARAKILNDDKGKPWRMIGLNMDVTERKQAEEEVRKLNDELEQRVIQRTAELEAANKELEAFTYSVSHDLRAPLRHISGFSKMLSEEFSASLPPDAQHQVQRIQEGTRRMGQLVDDLLNLGRVGRKELSLQVSGLRSIVDEVIESLKSDIGDRQVEWRIGDLPYVECDTALIQQVFQNLLSNALKFSRPRARALIEIGQEERDGSSVVYVRDNGVGFSMKYADKLFGVFQRLHRAEDFEGTGVGLATVQRIVQKHGGRIWAQAELDKGAAFYFTLGASDAGRATSQAACAGAKS